MLADPLTDFSSSFPSRDTQGLGRFAEIHPAPVERWRSLGIASSSIGWRELDAGDFSGPGSSDLVLVAIRSRVVRADLDFGAGRFSNDFRTGEFALIPPFVATQIKAHSAHALRILAIPYESLATIAPELTSLAPYGDFGPLHARKNADAAISQLIDAIASEIDGGAPEASMMIEGALLQVMGRLVRAARNTPAATARETLTSYQIQRIDEFIDAHITEPVTLADLSALLGLSVFHMARAYRNSVGQTLQSSVRQRRMARAVEMLRQSNATVTSVAMGLGFSTPQAFTRAFSKAHSMTPTDVIRSRT